MSVISKSPQLLPLLAVLAGAAPVGLAAQPQNAPAADSSVIVNGTRPADGPDVKGIISARSDDKMQVTAADGTNTVIAIDGSTRISGGGRLWFELHHQPGMRTAELSRQVLGDDHLERAGQLLLL